MQASEPVFPRLDDDWIEHPSANHLRDAWRLQVVEATEAWLTSNADIRIWMSAFRRLREDILWRAWERAMPWDFREKSTYILMGSAGRGEDLLFSDLDHGVLFSEPVPVEEHQPLLSRFIQTMNGLGWPVCQGFVMSTNPRWVGESGEWSERMERYFEFPDWENARYLFMVVDGRALEPCEGWERIRERVLSGIRKSAFICWEMAHLGIHRSVALTAFGRVRPASTQREKSLHVKEGLLNPILHSLRLMSVAHGFEGWSTWERLDYLRSVGVLDDAIERRVREAVEFGWRLRLLQQIADLKSHREAQEYVSLDRMAPLTKSQLMLHLETAKTLERFTHRQFRKPR